MSNVQVKYSLLDTEVKFNKQQTGIIYINCFLNYVSFRCIALYFEALCTKK